MTFSLDGPKKVNDLVRIRHDDSGTFDAVVANIHRYREVFPEKAQVECTVTQAHRDAGLSLTEVLDFCANDLGVEEPHIAAAGLPATNPLNPYRNGSGMQEDFVAAAEASMDTLLNGNDGPRKGGRLDVVASMVHRLAHRNPKPIMCPAGMSQIVVDAFGDIYPCWMFAGNAEHVMGNILRDQVRGPRALTGDQSHRRQFEDQESCLLHLLRKERLQRLRRQQSQRHRKDRGSFAGVLQYGSRDVAGGGGAPGRGKRAADGSGREREFRTLKYVDAEPKLLDDVNVWLLYPRGARSEEVYTVGSITADRYLAVPGSKLPAVQAFMHQLNGQQTLEEIQAAMIREHGFQLDVAALHRKFSRAGLLAQSGSGQAGDIQEMSTTFSAVADRPVTRVVPVILAGADADGISRVPHSSWPPWACFL